MRHKPAIPLFVFLAALAAAPSRAWDGRISRHLPNFGRVDESVYRGGQPDQKGFELLASLDPMPVKTVIDLRNSDSDRAQWEAGIEKYLGMRRISIPLSSQTLPRESEVAEFLSAVENPSHYPIFVHCHHGRDRTGTMIAIMRMAVDCWAAERAYREMLQYGFDVEAHPELKAYVFNYLKTHPRSPACSSSRR